ncbi:MAG: hypothetical protein Q9160_009294, partial [Pyrenula sp. 1 TL-2023]
LEAAGIYNGSFLPERSSFAPTRELMLDDGDLSLIFLSANGILYTGAVDDDWYSAHTVSGANVTQSFASGKVPLFLPDEPASVLACKSQYQTCDPTLPPERGCSSWIGMADSTFFIDTPRTKRERAIFWVFGVLDIYEILETLRASALTSRFRFREFTQAQLPVNQWQLDVEYWHNIILSALQGFGVDSATGPGDSEMLKYIWKILSTAYTNFSLMWLVIVLVTGALIVALESALESIVVWLERRGTIKKFNAEWFSHDALQLQRMAHEELGLGDWSDCTGPRVIPVTEKGQVLAILDTEDPTHPKLKKVGKESINSTITPPTDNSSGNETTLDGGEQVTHGANGSLSLDEGSQRSVNITYADSRRSNDQEIAAISGPISGEPLPPGASPAENNELQSGETHSPEDSTPRRIRVRHEDQTPTPLPSPTPQIGQAPLSRLGSGSGPRSPRNAQSTNFSV